MNPPLAYLLTWTCSGTWLHGDSRGSIDDEHFTPGTEFAPPDLARERGNRKQLAGNTVVLSPPDREAVERMIRAHCEYRGWWLGGVNVRSNHVHCVVGAPDTRPETVVQQLKSWSTRALREMDSDRFAGHVWTRHASTRYLWKQQEVERAVRYVLEGQDQPSRWKGE